MNLHAEVKSLINKQRILIGIKDRNRSDSFVMTLTEKHSKKSFGPMSPRSVLYKHNSIHENYNTIKAAKKIKFKLANKSPIISTLNFGGSSPIKNNDYSPQRSDQEESSAQKFNNIMRYYQTNLVAKEEASAKSSTVSANHKEGLPKNKKRRRHKKKQSQSSKRQSEQENDEMYQIIVTNSKIGLGIQDSHMLDRLQLSQVDATSSNEKNIDSSYEDDPESQREVTVIQRESMFSVMKKSNELPLDEKASELK